MSDKNELVQEVAQMRRNYKTIPLSKKDILSNPFNQFHKWFDETIESQAIYEPNAMALTTVSESGQPSTRVVLLKKFDENGFVFYTNYESRKGKEIQKNSKVSLLFYWGELARQVRIEGNAVVISETSSTEYFQSRPKGSQIGAWVSPQSKVVPSRQPLELKQEELEKEFADKDILPRPEHWGGYIVQPHTFEFWQGRSNRLHDRFRYQQVRNNWVIDRLAP